jgi:hypothetical protein
MTVPVAGEMHRIKDGSVVKIYCEDLGLRRYNGIQYYTSRFTIDGRKRALISRCERARADSSPDVLTCRYVEDMLALEGIGLV